jgi:hypothetical protein
MTIFFWRITPAIGPTPPQTPIIGTPLASFENRRFAVLSLDSIFFFIYRGNDIFERGKSNRGFNKKIMKERTAFPSFRQKLGGFQFASVLIRTRRPIPKKLLAMIK